MYQYTDYFYCKHTRQTVTVQCDIPKGHEAVMVFGPNHQSDSLNLLKVAVAAIKKEAIMWWTGYHEANNNAIAIGELIKENPKVVLPEEMFDVPEVMRRLPAMAQGLYFRALCERYDNPIFNLVSGLIGPNFDQVILTEWHSQIAFAPSAINISVDWSAIPRTGDNIARSIYGLIYDETAITEFIDILAEHKITMEDLVMRHKMMEELVRVKQRAETIKKRLNTGGGMSSFMDMLRGIAPQEQDKIKDEADELKLCLLDVYELLPIAQKALRTATAKEITAEIMSHADEWDIPDGALSSEEMQAGPGEPVPVGYAE